MDLPKRKAMRLPEYDYSAPGAYFVTVCTHGRRCLLSELAVGEGLAPPLRFLMQFVCSNPCRRVCQRLIWTASSYGSADITSTSYESSRTTFRFGNT